GQQPPNRNTRLAVVARNALRQALNDEIAQDIERQVEAGKLSLADLDTLAGKGKDISTGTLTLIFGSALPQEVALAFLGAESHDAEVEKKGARRDLILLLRDAFEADLPEESPLP